MHDRTGKLFSFQWYEGLTPDLVIIGKALQVSGVLLHNGCKLFESGKGWPAWTTSHATFNALRLSALLSWWLRQPDIGAHIHQMHTRIITAWAKHFASPNVFWGTGMVWFCEKADLDDTPASPARLVQVYNQKLCRCVFGYEPLDAFDKTLARGFPKRRNRRPADSDAGTSPAAPRRGGGSLAGRGEGQGSGRHRRGAGGAAAGKEIATKAFSI